MALQVNSPFPQFFDLDGSPLDEGFIYIGTANANPEINSIQVYWDSAQTIPAIQPLRTVNGYIARNGTPSAVFVNANSFSCTAKNANSELVIYSPSVASASLASVASAQAAAAAADASADAAAASAAKADATAASVLTTTELEDYLAKIRLPIGGVIPMGQSTVPYGYLECNGAAVSRVTYSLLFAAIGTTYGVGDGVNTFNVPDLRGEFVRGWDHGRGVDSGRAIASAQGHQLQDHTHDVKTGSGNGASLIHALRTLAIDILDSVTGTVAAGYNKGTETRPRNVAMMYVIKAFDAAVDSIEPNYNKSPVTAVTSSGGVLNLNLTLGNYFTVALTENVTSITFSNLPGSGFGTTVMVRITQGLGSYTVAWPASFRWEGAAPTVSTANGAVDVLAILTFDNGTKWDAILSEGRV